MKPNLSLKAIATTLALMGTSGVLDACSKRAPGTAAPEQSASPAASTAAATEATPPAPVVAAPGPGGPSPSASASGRRKMRGGSTSASCGAGNCATDPKKK